MNILSIDLDFFGNRGYINPASDCLFLNRAINGLFALLEECEDNDIAIDISKNHGSILDSKNITKSLYDDHHLDIINFDFHDDLQRYNEYKQNEDASWVSLLLNSAPTSRYVWILPNANTCFEKGKGLCRVVNSDLTPNEFINVRNKTFDRTKFDIIECSSINENIFKKYVKFDNNKHIDYVFLCISEQYVSTVVLQTIVKTYNKLYKNTSSLAIKKLYKIINEALIFRYSIHNTYNTDLNKDYTDLVICINDKNLHNSKDILCANITDLHTVNKHTYSTILLDYILNEYTSDDYSLMYSLSFKLKTADGILLAAFNEYDDSIESSFKIV